MADALSLWQDKLNFLLREEAKASDGEQKFKLQQDIVEARTKIREAESESPATAFGHPLQFRSDISRIIKYAPAELIGREAETSLLSDA